MKYVYAGDRDIAVKVLRFLINQGYKPEALMVPTGSGASHSEVLKNLIDLSPSFILEGNNFQTEKGKHILEKINPDYIIGIHFPYIISPDILKIPSVGFINLHPAYLPFNRGWHTPSWSILEGTPAGATLHFMAEQLDSGDIIHQKELKVGIDETADTLYKKLKSLEFEVFQEAFNDLLSLNPQRFKQNLTIGNAHNKKDLLKPEIQEIDLFGRKTFKEFFDKIRSLSTNNLSEAAYFIYDGKKYRVQLIIKESHF